MKKLGIIILAAMLALPVLAGKPTRSVRHCDANTNRMGAMLYALPKVDVRIEIKAVYTISKPGPFAQYAERYLADDKAILRESKVWRFESAKVKESFSADSSRMYLVTGETESVQFIGGSCILKSVGCWDVKDGDKKCGDKNGHHGKSFKECIDTVFHTELLGEEALTSTSIPKMAERAAKQIFQLREARMAILSCDVAHQPDGKATKEILARIDRDERELTALFMGKKVTVKESRSFDIDVTEQKHNLIVARMSTIEGIVTADEMIGTPIYVNITPKKMTAPAETKKSVKAKKGYYYIVPGAAEIEVRHGDKYNIEKTIEVPQNGYATWLTPKVGNIIFTQRGTIHKIK